MGNIQPKGQIGREVHGEMCFSIKIQLTTSSTNYSVVAQMSVDLVEFVILVGVVCGLPRLKYVA